MYIEIECGLCTGECCNISYREFCHVFPSLFHIVLFIGFSGWRGAPWTLYGNEWWSDLSRGMFLFISRDEFIHLMRRNNPSCRTDLFIPQGELWFPYTVLWRLQARILAPLMRRLWLSNARAWQSWGLRFRVLRCGIREAGAHGVPSPGKADE